MIRNSLLMQAADELGLYAGDDLVRSAIRTIPLFRLGAYSVRPPTSAVLACRG